MRCSDFVGQFDFHLRVWLRLMVCITGLVKEHKHTKMVSHNYGNQKSIKSKIFCLV